MSNLPSIVYTFKTPIYYIHGNTVDIQKQWLKKSSTSAFKAGHNVILYTNDYSIKSSFGIEDIIYVEDNSFAWDSLKIKVLENPPLNNFILSDNDIIFKKPLEFLNNIDMYFDIVEREFSWNSFYLPTLKQITSLNILKGIDFWSDKLGYTYNLGILTFNNRVLIEKYIYYWRKIESLLDPYIGYPLNPYLVTPILSQYLLTLISREYNVKPVGSLHKNPELENEFYSHYRGGLKRKFFKNPI